MELERIAPETLAVSLTMTGFMLEPKRNGLHRRQLKELAPTVVYRPKAAALRDAAS